MSHAPQPFVLMSQREAEPAGTHGRKGEKPPSLTVLFEDEEGPLLRFACGITGRREVAEELVQEAFLRLHRQWAAVENPRAWIYRATRNLALSWLRDHQRESSLDDGRAENLPADPDAMPPDEALGRMEATGLVRLFLAELPAQDRELIQLKYTEGLRYADISARTGLSVGNVGYRLHHALRGLATSLRQVGVSGSEG